MDHHLSTFDPTPPLSPSIAHHSLDRNAISAPISQGTQGYAGECPKAQARTDAKALIPGCLHRPYRNL